MDRSYSNAADMARLTGFHRTTVVEKIKNNRIRAVKKKIKNERYKIYEKYFEVRTLAKAGLKKPYEKHYKWYKGYEDHVILFNPHLSNAELAKMLKRSTNSVSIRKSRLKKR